MTVQPTHNLSDGELDKHSVFHSFTALRQHLKAAPRTTIAVTA